MSANGPKKSLDRLLLEVRAQHPPPPRDTALPARLRAEFRSLAAQPRSSLRRTQRSRIAGWQLGVAGAVAAGTLLVLQTVGSESVGPESVRPTQIQPGPVSVLASVDGLPLAAGAVLEADSVPRSVQHPGRASWVLLPGSRASLLSAGAVVRVDLERGSLMAQVQPSEQPETFVVQARGTEVAVHGTRFSVSLQGERVRVEVSEGSVQVRPVGQQAAILLREHMRADFAAGALLPARAPLDEHAGLSPGVSAEVEPAPQPSAAPPAAPGPVPLPAVPHTLARGPAKAAPPPAPAAPLRDAASERAVRAVTEHVQACFRRHLPGSRELGIEVSTRLGLWVEASGQLLRADFEPPLAPDIESCVAEQLVQFRAAPSPEGYRVERALVLQR